MKIESYRNIRNNGNGVSGHGVMNGIGDEMLRLCVINNQ